MDQILHRRKIPHVKDCLHPISPCWPHHLALSQHSNPTGAAVPGAPRAGHSSYVTAQLVIKRTMSLTFPALGGIKIKPWLIHRSKSTYFGFNT